MRARQDVGRTVLAAGVLGTLPVPFWHPGGAPNRESPADAGLSGEGHFSITQQSQIRASFRGVWTLVLPPSGRLECGVLLGGLSVRWIDVVETRDA